MKPIKEFLKPRVVYMVNKCFNIIFTLILRAVLILIMTAFATTANAKNVVLDGRISLEEQLRIPNVTYIINDIFTQTDSVIIIPNNCTLAFKNGKILNANLILGENVRITNGTIEIADNGYIMLNNNTTIKNCSFSNQSYCKIGYGNLYAEACQGIRIIKCYFAPQKRQTKGKCSSIDLRRCEDFLVEKVKSDYTEGENIIVFEGTGIVRKCNLRMGWSGIGTTIYGTTVEHPKVGRWDSKIRIVNNTVKNALAAGITINSNNVICEKNDVTFDNCTVNGPGIRLGHAHSPANSCVVSKNVIKWYNSKSNGKSTTNRGISLDAGNDNLVLGNSIENVPVGIGSSVTNKTGTEIKKNVIKGATNYGISIYESNDAQNSCTIRNNEIRMSTGTGIWVRNCNTEITNNSIFFPREKREYKDNSNSCVGLRLEDNKNVEIRVENNTIKYSLKPIKGEFVGKRVVMKDNVYQTEGENTIKSSEKTIVEDLNNKIKYVGRR